MEPTNSDMVAQLTALMRARSGDAQTTVHTLKTLPGHAGFSFSFVLARPDAPARKRIARLMRIQGLRARPRRRYRTTTDSRHGLPVCPNLLARRFAVGQPNTVWVTDMTYIWTLQGWLYLAVIIDLFSRRVVGWSMSERIDRKLALDALRMALAQRRPPRGLIHHSDRGSQYASGDYQELLAQHGLRGSMSRRGDCWDNAVAESFFARCCSPSRACPARAHPDLASEIPASSEVVREHRVCP